MSNVPIIQQGQQGQQDRQSGDISRNARIYTKKRVDWFNIVNIIVLTFLALMVIFPFYYVLVVSFVSEAEYNTSSLLYPKNPITNHYQTIILHSGLLNSFRNSGIVVVLGIVYNMLLTISMSYGLSKKNFPGRALLFNLVIFTMYFSGGLIPYYLLVRNLGLRDSLFSIVLPFGLNVFFMIILKNFMQQIPAELEESAKIDGANQLRILVQIIIPMVVPAIATLILFYSVDRWNEWFSAMLFINNRALYPVQLMLREILTTGSTLQNVPSEISYRPFGEGIKSASVMVVMLPVMCIYPFLQKYFVKGVMIGAIKS